MFNTQNSLPMRKHLLFIYVVMAMASLFGSCKNDTVTPDPVPPTPDDPTFTIDIVECSHSSVDFRVTPSDDSMTYMLMITTKEYFDSFEDDAAIIEDDLLWFEESAYEEGIDLKEYLAELLKSGIVEDSQANLNPDTVYCIYAYGLTTKGKVLTDLYVKEFTTQSVEQIDINFKLNISDIGYNDAILTVEADNTSAPYFVNVLSQEDYDYWGGDDTAFKAHLIALREYYLAMGATADQMLANLGSVGKSTIEIKELKPNTKYLAYAIGVNNEFLANSKPGVIEFETLTSEQSDLTFEVDITSIEYDRITGTVTPSNNDDGYIVSVQLADALNWYDSEEDFMQSIIDDINYWQGGVDKVLRKGITSLDTISGLQPLTDYVVVCFGFQGAPTTKLSTFPFTTIEAAGDPEELVVEFDITEITHNSVKIVTTPSVGAYYFVTYSERSHFEELVAELGSNDLAVRDIVDADIDYGAEYFGCSRADYLYDMGACLGVSSNKFTQLTPATEYVALAMAVDIDSGEIAAERGFISEVFATIEKIYSDATVSFTFGNYYDGTALAELYPEKYLNCLGYVVLPYSVQVNDSADTWYTNFYQGDYTEWGCTDDDIYAELITYGYNWDPDSVSVCRESGIAVLTYDTPFTFLGIAKDINSNFGHGTIDVVTLTRDGVSPAEEFLSSQPTATASISKLCHSEKPKVATRR